MENGPGPQVWAFSPGGGRNFSVVAFASPSHGLSLIPRHTIMVMVPPRLEGSRACCARSGHRILEELSAKPGKAKIVHGLERIALHVGFQEFDVGEAGRLGGATPVFQEPVTAVDAEHRSGGTDQARELDGGVAETAAGVDHSVALAHVERGKDLGAVQRQAVDEDVAPAHEFRDQHVVPELDVLASGSSLNFGIAHGMPRE